VSSGFYGTIGIPTFLLRLNICGSEGELLSTKVPIGGYTGVAIMVAPVFGR